MGVTLVDFVISWFSMLLFENNTRCLLFLLQIRLILSKYLHIVKNTDIIDSLNQAEKR